MNTVIITLIHLLLSLTISLQRLIFFFEGLFLFFPFLTVPLHLCRHSVDLSLIVTLHRLQTLVSST